MSEAILKRSKRKLLVRKQSAKKPGQAGDQKAGATAGEGCEKTKDNTGTCLRGWQ